MDNNILAAGEYGLQQLQKIIDRGYKVDFNQAMDARLVTPPHCGNDGKDKVAQLYPFWLRHKSADCRVRKSHQSYQLKRIQKGISAVHNVARRYDGVL